MGQNHVCAVTEDSALTDLEGMRVIAAAGMPTNFNQNTYCIVSAVDMAEKLGVSLFSAGADYDTGKR
ncbi:MAG: hypothetical protein ACLTC4_06995 [Hungatella hathewayi]